ncbi:MAG: SAM-dependent methyltransferase [Clostridia bacterium]|nr:SAM-dependent methyltransferase [Clostridia bacterium]
MKPLSQRLETIATLVPIGARVCDIGCDHGYLAIYLRLKGIAKTVIAADLNELPLERARKNIEKLNADNIDLRLCDGLAGIEKDEVDTVIIAGMGGNVIAGIVERCDFAKSDALTFILQPTTSAEVLREFLCKNGFDIVSETVVYENDKLYSVMVVKFKNQAKAYPNGFYYIGKIAPNTEDGVKYIKKQQKRLFEASKALENIKEKQAEYSSFKSAYDYIAKILTE